MLSSQTSSAPASSRTSSLRMTVGCCPIPIRSSWIRAGHRRSASRAFLTQIWAASPTSISTNATCDFGVNGTGGLQGTDRWQFLDDTTKIIGKHTLKAGFEYRWERWFTGQLTSAMPASSTSVLRTPAHSTLLATPISRHRRSVRFVSPRPGESAWFHVFRHSPITAVPISRPGSMTIGRSPIS